MVYRPLQGRKGYWLRQFNDTGERTLDAILDTMTVLGGGSCLCAKVADGLTWQGKCDRAGLTPIFSLEDVLALRDHCHARGVTLLPVVVPRGENASDEAAMHSEIAAAVGALMTDIEAYAGFWDRSPLDLIPTYTGLLRQAAPTAFLINQPDPRGFAVAAAHVEDTAGDFDAIAAQHYVGWAEVGWLDVDTEVRRFELLAALGRQMYVTLWGIERTDLALSFWEQVRHRCQGVNMFRFGVMNARNLQDFATMPGPEILADPIGGPPVVNPPPLKVTSTAPIAGFDAQLVDTIVSYAIDQHLPPDLLLSMAFVESGLDPNAAVETRAEKSYGIFQININAHGGDKNAWIGFGNVLRSMQEMISRWHWAFTLCGAAAAWQTDAVTFLETFHPIAQGSDPLKHARAVQCVGDGKRVFAAWQAATGGVPRPIPQSVTELTATVIASTSANFREAPSDAAVILGTVPRGTEVQLRRQEFYPVLWKATIGWMWGAFLTFTPATGNAPPADIITATTTAPRGLNFRLRPDDSSPVLDIAPPGSLVQLRREAFYPVSVDDRDGWIWGPLLSFHG